MKRRFALLSGPSAVVLLASLSNSGTSVLIQTCHPYTGDLSSEMSGDSKNVFLHCEEGLDSIQASMANNMFAN